VNVRSIRGFLVFSDVIHCNDVAEFNLFVRRYLEERGVVVPSESVSKIFWALFYRWKESMSLVG
jgi:hypothetical protein